MLQSSGDNAGHEERLRYQELFDFAPEGYVLTDSAGLIRELNHAAAALLKARREFLVGKPFVLFLSEPSQRVVYSHLSRLAVLQPGSVMECDVWMRPVRASPTPVNLNVADVPNEAGAPRTLRWRLRDITAHVRAQRDRQAEKSLTDGLVEAAQAAILVLDVEGRILRSNPFARQLFGFEAEEMRGVEWASLSPPPNRVTAAFLVQECTRFLVARRFTGEAVGKGGVSRIVAWSVQALPHLEDVPAAVVVVGHDITELQAAQREAVQSARLAAIGQVTASLTHESRNAIQRARACLDRLRWRLPDSPDATDLLDRANLALGELAALFEDVRAFASPTRLDVAPCRVQDVWREAWSRALAVVSGPLPTFAEDVGIEGWISADRARLVQVFRNLFENAIQVCGPGGRIEVVCREGNQDGQSAVRVAVLDSGPGLGPSAERLFEPFFTTKPRGTGLGLSIARRIIEAHGGRLTAADREGGGAEFTILFPRSQR